MARKVIEGSPGNLRIVRLSQLPFNFDNSYFRYVRLIGTSSTPRSGRYIDFVDGECRADLTSVDTTGMESFNSDWRGVTLAENQVERLCNYDITRGFMWQESKEYLDASTSLSQAAKDAILHAAPPDLDRRSWKRMFARWMQVTGYTAAQVRQHLTALYGPHARIFQNYRNRVGGDDVADTPALRVYRLTPDGPRDTFWPASAWPQVMRDIARNHDRWALARAAEQAAQARFGEEIVARSKMIWPVFDFVAVPRRMVTHGEEWGIHYVAAGEQARIRELSARGMPLGDRVG